MLTRIVDIETDGLNPTVIHCAVVRDYGTKNVRRFTARDMHELSAYLSLADIVVAHNGIGFDYRVMARLANWVPRAVQKVYDSLVLSRFLWSDIKEIHDYEAKAKRNFPGRMLGRHGLEAWGHRLGKHKGDYAKEMKKKGLDPWAKFTPEMMSYCENDVDVTHDLWTLIREGLSRAINPHHVRVDFLTSRQRLKEVKQLVDGFEVVSEAMSEEQTLHGPYYIYIDVDPSHKYSKENMLNYGALVVAAIKDLEVSIEDAEVLEIQLRGLPGYVSFNTLECPGVQHYIPLRHYKNAPSWALDRDAPISPDTNNNLDHSTFLRTRLARASKHRGMRFRVIKGDVEKALGPISKIKACLHAATNKSAMDLEHDLATYMTDLETDGVDFDVEHASKMLVELLETGRKLEQEIIKSFPPRYVDKKAPTKKEPSRTKSTLQPFNVGSRVQLRQRIFTDLPWETLLTDAQAMRGLGADARPKAYAEDEGDQEFFVGLSNKQLRYLFTDCPDLTFRRKELLRMMDERVAEIFDRKTEKGSLVIDTVILDKLAVFFPVCGLISQWYLVQKRVGQLKSGQNSWFNLLTKENIIHPHINPHGAVTARATHSSPNISQTPAVLKAKRERPDGTTYEEVAFGLEGEWGADSRQCFIPAKGYKLLGADLAGLELRMFAHYLQRSGGDGTFLKTLLTEDVHESNRKLLGFANRTDAKRFIFALLYGAGAEKIGSIVMPNATKEKKISDGKRLKDAALKGISGFSELNRNIMQQAENGFIVAIDGRFIPVRSTHAALNTALQSGGAIVAKQWIKNVVTAADAAGLTRGRGKDWWLIIWSHDEIQCNVRPEHVELMRKIVLDAAVKVEHDFKLACPIAAEAKVGDNWFETH